MPSEVASFFGGPLAVNVFLLGAAGNLYVFQRMGFPLERVMGAKDGDLPTARGLGAFAALLFGILGLLYIAFRRSLVLVMAKFHEVALVFYCLVVLLLLFAPFDVLHRRARMFLGKKLYKCVFPLSWKGTATLRLPMTETPFVEVFLADGLTSMSKVFYDVAVGVLMLMESLDGRHSDWYGAKMKPHPLPYLCAAWPYLIRATQCLISYRRAPLANDKFLHLLNTFKYGTGLSVIVVGALPAIFGTAPASTSFLVLDGQTMFLLCACCNSLYSFFWDVVMDWGLCQPAPAPSRDLESHVVTPVQHYPYLRQQLHYKSPFVYYVAMGVDGGLRILWATSNWEWVDLVGAEFKVVMQVAEVLRRCMWNCFRVEWQCVKHGFELRPADVQKASGLLRSRKPKNSNDKLNVLEETATTLDADSDADDDHATKPSDDQKFVA
ncbi:hypothetical protein SPRG_07671 [Saprolegnia parasitica CBS 223.65]|uniref:EXS domain-containing protein n=1 Tax=Saprolegnia parasitica (strain CBS 223.65) TaxID=695850 RepID=A0A067C8W1_SAPPC|nr:hypothetical protein SPRG_07671 [Saprolegnia parasitica CBS 223.65]KDO26958.1 hypothetical protein SPRG_07671 [Saprolegnia parasitica CBS 223.65]|eukprot:XP_012202339.1 hypothetical protein SPRG_07671 [Saprolegnia parasitica CBS 223.65]